MRKPLNLAPPPPVAPETWRALLGAAAEFAALRPWEFTWDSHIVGLIDQKTGERKIGSVLGNAGEVFAAVFYRGVGLRWILSMLSEDPAPFDFNNAEGMDCLQMEFVRRTELSKEDKAVLKAAAFEPASKRGLWPQFRSFEPGWHPWYITEAEAIQLLADIPRLTAFCRLLERNSGLFDDRSTTDVPFLPKVLPDRPLTSEDLDWQPLVVPPEAVEVFNATPDQLEKLRALKRNPSLECEFDCSMLPGASFVENGRPCFGRVSLLVETHKRMVVGIQVLGGALTAGQAAGQGLVKSLTAAETIPATITVGGSRIYSVLEPLCRDLGIELQQASSLPAVEEAVNSLSEFLIAGSGPLKI